MEIETGRIKHAKKVVIYGPEGIGKSTFASQFPDPIFIDTEGSTKELDIIRYKRPTSWMMLLEQIKHAKELITKPVSIDKTLVIDTADWAEILCIQHICDKHNFDGVEGFGYGKGYTYLAEEYGRFLNRLDDFIELGKNVVITAHAIMRKIEQPEEMGAYDHWELKLQKKTAPLLKEWADMVLFANYKIYVVEDSKTKKSKAQGGTRVMYTCHHACWDAKNRYNLAEELPFNFNSISHLFDAEDESSIDSEPEPVPKKPAVTKPREDTKPKPESNLKAEKSSAPASKPVTEQNEKAIIPDHLKALYDLMNMDFVTKEQVQRAVAHRGYFPIDTPLENYPADFVASVLVSAWPKVHNLILKLIDEDFSKE